MFDRLDELATELEKLEARLSDIYASGDQDAAREAGRRHAELKPIVETYERVPPGRGRPRRRARDARATRPTARCASTSRARSRRRRPLRAELEAQLNELLVPKDPNDGRNVIVEIRGAEGGEEGNLWAGDLFRMYERYAERHRWKIEVLERAGVRHGRLPRRDVLGEGARGVVAARSTRAACTGCNGSPPPRARVASTPARPRWWCSPRPRRSTSQIDPERPRDRRLPLERSRAGSR